MREEFSFEVGGRTISIETGRLARQADGAVLVRIGDTVVLATAVVSDKAREGIDFLPLVVNYQEKAYAAGKIPGGFFKREGRPGERETLISRLIDRPIRPLFPKGFRNEIQVIITTLSSDQENDSDIIGIIGASTALHLSKIPFAGPIGGVRIGRVDGAYVVNPTTAQIQAGDMNIVVAGTKDSILMVEAGARMVSEEIILGALSLAQEEIRKVVAIQEIIREKLGIAKIEFTPNVTDPALVDRVWNDYGTRLREAIVIRGKHIRAEALAAIRKDATEAYTTDEALLPVSTKSSSPWRRRRPGA